MKTHFRFLFAFVMSTFCLGGSARVAHAVFDDAEISPAPWAENGLLESLINAGVADQSDYQIGDEWGKRPVSRETLRGKAPAFVRAALATARYGGATAFYLGKFNGHHMMATNHHVMPQGSVCARRSAIFPLLQKSFPCEKFYGEWSGIDLALFSITVPADDERLLANVGRNFSFHGTIYPGQELVTIGFGVWKNPGRELMANQDADCKVFSEKDEARFMADPDLINPADYKAWSFSTGCDVSHGDSGSAMVDRRTGEVVGIIWTTATQKPERIRSSAYLDELLKKQGGELWQWLSYAVPAPKMREFLDDYLQRSRPTDADVVETLGSILSH